MHKTEFQEFLEQTAGLLDDMVLGRLSIRSLYYPRSTYYYKLRKFKKQGLLKPQNRKKYPNTLILTDKGRELIKKSKAAVKRTDGLSTIVLFDIPEEKRKARDTLRRYLIRSGYTTIMRDSV